ncbi:MAG: MnhB domain-containing protein [Bacillota bacterium]|nr:MAG: Na(+)/H(+) antiporter subunit B [Bacillota bacterium]
MVRARIEQNPIVRVVVHTSLYGLKVIAFWILLRGHHEPGGGFIAGLLIAAVIAMQGVAFGTDAAQAILPVPPQYLLGGGLLLSFTTVLAPALFGGAFMEHAAGVLHLPLFGEVHWTTALLFDIGVFFVVVGTMKTVLLTIAADPVVPRRTPAETAAGSAEREVS